MYSSHPKIEHPRTAGRRDSSSRVAEFYDKFQPRLLRDYVYGNARVSAAVDRVCSQIRADRQSVLDVGCGIGCTSAEYLARRPWVKVLGVDISPKNIEVAEKLFGSDGLAFSISSLESVPDEASFDVVALVDVYEHIPRSNWPAFNEILKLCMSPKGVLVLTTPSLFHQQFLAKNKPAELQIVDETVEFNDVLVLKEAIGGTLVCYEYVSIWNSNDYLHLVIDRDPRYQPLQAVSATRRSSQRRTGMKSVNKLPATIKARREQVRRLLGIDLQ